MDARALCRKHLKEIKEYASRVGENVKVMEVCGGHTNTVMRYGIRDILPGNVQLLSGPGCPVCVSPQRDIDCIVELALNGVPIATYGDMLRVPGSRFSLAGAKAQGAKVYPVYSVLESEAIAKREDNLVFFGVGFETTTPMSAHLLGEGVPVYSVHRRIVPAMNALTDGVCEVDGFIAPGHVSAVTGTHTYREVCAPQAVTGFSAEQFLRGLAAVMKMICEGDHGVVNAYSEVVTEEGNPLAMEAINEHFEVSDANWRGLGEIPGSGYEVADESLNAKKIHEAVLGDVGEPPETGCLCSEILKGLIKPPKCPLYGSKCNLDEPVGPCMVSAEGGCNIYMRYGEESG